jgi:hypothetical protein
MCGERVLLYPVVANPTTWRMDINESLQAKRAQAVRTHHYDHCCKGGEGNIRSYEHLSPLLFTSSSQSLEKGAYKKKPLVGFHLHSGPYLQY